MRIVRDIGGSLPSDRCKGRRGGFFDFRRLGMAFGAMEYPNWYWLFEFWIAYPMLEILQWLTQTFIDGVVFRRGYFW
jgi:hypothetical protein